jgi:hypothetical protein
MDYIHLRIMTWPKLIKRVLITTQTYSNQLGFEKKVTHKNKLHKDEN